MMFLCLFVLTTCQMQKKPDQTFTVQTDTAQRERKEPITIENLPGIDAPVILDEDTVYTESIRRPYSRLEIWKIICKKP